MFIKREYEWNLKLFYWKNVSIQNYTFTIFEKLKNCKKDIESVNPEVSKTSNGKIMLISKCSMCNNKPKLFEKQEAVGLLNKLEIKTPLSKIATLGDISFLTVLTLNYNIKWMKWVKKLLLLGDKSCLKSIWDNPKLTKVLADH